MESRDFASVHSVPPDVFAARLVTAEMVGQFIESHRAEVSQIPKNTVRDFVRELSLNPDYCLVLTVYRGAESTQAILSLRGVTSSETSWQVQARTEKSAEIALETLKIIAAQRLQTFDALVSQICK